MCIPVKMNAGSTVAFQTCESCLPGFEGENCDPISIPDTTKTIIETTNAPMVIFISSLFALT